MSDDASDVTKALAAFGAPAIRYHSFGQAQVRPSSVVLPRRIVPPASGNAVTEQAEPVAAPEPVPALRAAPVAGSVQAASVREPDSGRSSLFPAVSTAAPPPRPLAEWAAPVVPAVPIASVVPAAPVPRPIPPPPMIAPLPPPAIGAAIMQPTIAPRAVVPPMLSIPSPDVKAAVFPDAPLLQAAAAGQPPFSVSLPSPAPISAGTRLALRNLPRIFEFLAASPPRAGFPSPRGA